MIKKYNGYCVSNAEEDVKKIASKVYNTVSECVYNLLEEENK